MKVLYICANKLAVSGHIYQINLRCRLYRVTLYVTKLEFNFLGLTQFKRVL
jgi:hypothetical protein